MARGRQAGVKNRNYPPLPLAEAVKVPTAIEDQASGMTVSRLTLAPLLGSTPTSRVFKDLIGSSRFFGLTNGGINAEEFSLTELGKSAAGGDEVAQVAALKAAVMSVSPYAAFFKAFNGKKFPSAGPLKEFLVRDAQVPDERVEECAQYLAQDAKTAGMVIDINGADWIDLSGTPSPTPVESEADGVEDDASADAEGDTPALDAPDPGATGAEKRRAASDEAVQSGAPKKVFIAHGKNRVPLDQLKKALDQFKVKYAVAVDEPNRGRPISKKVAQLMEDECSSGIFIFTADERFTREKEDGTSEEVWRPSENVVFELGAASILYDTRIVIFKEKGVSFPSDFSDLGYIEFEKDQLVAELGALFAELVGLDILEVRAKG